MKPKRRALILGVGGQDGSYLADILLEKDYEVHGLYRRSSVDNLWRIHYIRDRIVLHQGDITDCPSIQKAIELSMPHEIYNEADQDNVGWSNSVPGYSCDVTIKAVCDLLEMVCSLGKDIRVFQPVSATMFGDAPYPQDESTLLDPKNPYAIAKMAAYYFCQYYRQERGLFVSTAILYNHDSPRRRGDYLLQTIAQQAIDVSEGKADSISLGNLDLDVDIGYAKEFMEAAWSILQLGSPDDFVLSTGKGWNIAELAGTALSYLGANRRIETNPKFSRSGREPTLIGNYTKAKQAFEFDPRYGAASVLRLIIDSIRERSS